MGCSINPKSTTTIGKLWSLLMLACWDARYMGGSRKPLLDLSNRGRLHRVSGPRSEIAWLFLLEALIFDVDGTLYRQARLTPPHAASAWWQSTPAPLARLWPTIRMLSAVQESAGDAALGSTGWLISPRPKSRWLRTQWNCWIQRRSRLPSRTGWTGAVSAAARLRRPGLMELWAEARRAPTAAGGISRTTRQRRN